MNIIIKAPLIEKHNKGLFIRKSYYYQILITNAFKQTEYMGHLYLPNIRNIRQASLYVLCFVLKCIQYIKHLKQNYSIAERINIYINNKTLNKEFKRCFIFKYYGLSMLIRCNHDKYTPLVREFRNLASMFPLARLKPYWKATDITA